MEPPPPEGELPLWRNTDPASSANAAALHARSGRFGTEKQRVYEEIVRKPGQNASEIGQNIGMMPYIVRKRTADLRNAGLAKSTLPPGETQRWWAS